MITAKYRSETVFIVYWNMKFNTLLVSREASGTNKFSVSIDDLTDISKIIQ